MVYGRWPVREALHSGGVSKLLLANGTNGEPVEEVVSLARQKKVPFLWVDRRKLDQLVGANHQGMVAYVSPLQTAPIETLWERAKNHKGQGPCLLFLDGIQDPQNLGSILRSAVFFGVPGVVIPKWRAAPLTGAAVRASAGAARLIPVAQVSNLPTAMEEARDRGIWLAGADMDGVDVKKADVPRPFALVMGSEGEGLHQLVRKKCDLIVRLGSSEVPGVGSLNVGVACGAFLHHLS